MKEFGDMKDACFGDYLHSVEPSHQSDCKEVTQKMLAEYDAWLHKDVFPPAKPELVTAMAGDGHEKVLTKVCAGAGDKMPKKPPQTHHGKPKPFTNGWFMLINPADGRILSVGQQFELGSNDICAKAMLKIVGAYPKFKCFNSPPSTNSRLSSAR